MLIGVKKRFVFVANSKTGSTSIEAVLMEHAEINRGGSADRKHISWCDVRREYAFLFDNSSYSPETFFRFGVVREPADWVRSWYNYRRFKKKPDIPANTSFETFWARKDWIKKTNQKKHFVDDDGVCRFDLIVPIEELKSGLPAVFNALGVEAREVPARNISRGELSRSEIPGPLIDEINMHYKEDLLFYNEWRENYKERLRQALEKIAKTSGALQEIIVSSVENDMIETAKLASLPADIASGAPFDIKGVVIPKPVCKSEGMRLVVSDERGEREVSWDLPSPKWAKSLPDNPRAARARFKAQGVLVKKGIPVEIYLVEGNGARHVLFKLEIKEQV